MKLTSKYLPQFVYGATDGTITTFAIVSSVVGAGLSPAIILLLGIANVLADGFSMASSNYLSIKSEVKSHSDSIKDTSTEVSPMNSAIVTFVSFVMVGTIPLLPFITGLLWPSDSSTQFTYSIIATACAFIISGIIRAKVTSQNTSLAVFETLLVGGIAAYIAYLVGYLLKGIA